MYTWWSSVVGLKTSDIIGKHWEGTFLCTMSTFAFDTISTFCRYYTLLLEKWVECRIFNCKRAEWPVSSNAADLTLFVVSPFFKTSAMFANKPSQLFSIHCLWRWFDRQVRVLQAGGYGRFVTRWRKSFPSMYLSILVASQANGCGPLKCGPWFYSGSLSAH